jgi:3-phosphoshikimate 1-carboxyvinyltransferase
MKLSSAQRLRGRIRLPGDKSISHRAAMIAALAEDPTEISNFSTAQDCASTVSCLRDLGVSIAETQRGKLSFAGGQKLATPRKPLDCGNSGSTMRMLAGVLAGHELTAELVGDESLSSRPMRRIIEPLELMGAKIEATDGKPPLKIHGRERLKAIAYKLPVASAQVKSAILFAGLNANGRTTVIETSQSRDHTELLFRSFGVDVTSHDLSHTLEGPARFNGSSITIPGDISSAAFFIAAAMLLPGSELVIEDVGLNPTRSAFLSVLQSWGADISESDVRRECNEPVGTIKVRGTTGLTAQRADRVLGGSAIPALIDELPLLAVVGSQVKGGIEIRDAAELRFKESDRLKTTAQNLRAMGADVTELPDGLRIASPTKLHGAELDSCGDHRIAMAFSVAALIADSETQIRGSESAAVSFPEFYELLNSLIES